MPFEDEDRKIEKGAKRIKELKETTIGRRSQIEMVFCDEIGSQFIEECDVKEIGAGNGKKETEDGSINEDGTITSPHTGEDVQAKRITAIDTTNKENMPMAILGSSTSPVTSFFKSIGWKNAESGRKSFNMKLFALQSAVISFLIGIIIFDIEPATALIDSSPFQIATASITSGGLVLVYEEYQHRKNDNYYEMRFFCLDHIMDGNVHVGVSLDDPDCVEHIKKWYGDKSSALISALQDLEEDLVDKTKELKQENHELEARLEIQKEKNSKRIADKVVDSKLEYKNMDNVDDTKVALYVVLSVVITAVSTVGLIYALGGL